MYLNVINPPSVLNLKSKTIPSYCHAVYLQCSAGFSRVQGPTQDFPPGGRSASSVVNQASASFPESKQSEPDVLCLNFAK